MKYLRKKILTIAFLMEGGAVALAFILSRFFQIPLSPLSDNIFRDILLGTVLALPPFIFFLFTLSEKAKKLPLIGPLRQKVVTDIKAIFDNMRLMDFVILSLLAGIGEELLFRGILQVKFGIIVASIIFGLMHSVSFAYVVAAIVMGFYIGGIYYGSGSLLVPIQIHFIYDLAALVYLRYFIGNPDKEYINTGESKDRSSCADDAGEDNMNKADNL